jgi:hypothetical protein
MKVNNSYNSNRRIKRDINSNCNLKVIVRWFLVFVVVLGYIWLARTAQNPSIVSTIEKQGKMLFLEGFLDQPRPIKKKKKKVEPVLNTSLIAEEIISFLSCSSFSRLFVGCQV